MFVLLDVLFREKVQRFFKAFQLWRSPILCEVGLNKIAWLELFASVGGLSQWPTELGALKIDLFTLLT